MTDAPGMLLVDAIRAIASLEYFAAPHTSSTARPLFVVWRSPGWSQGATERRPNKSFNGAVARAGHAVPADRGVDAAAAVNGSVMQPPLAT